MTWATARGRGVVRVVHIHAGMSDIHEGVTIAESSTTKEPLIERALEHLADVVNRLVRLEIAAADALAAAGERFTSPELAALASDAEMEHREHARSLSALVVDLGGEPAEAGALRSLLDRARVRLRQLQGDRGVLTALADIESDLVVRYDEAIAEVGFTDDERAVMGAGKISAADACDRLRAACADLRDQ